jgi:hypothetical protein
LFGNKFYRGTTPACLTLRIFGVAMSDELVRIGNRIAGLFGLLLVLHQPMNAQSIQLTDSLYHIFKERPVFTAKYDTRNTFITGNRASIWSVKVGLVFKKSMTVGIGYNWLWTGIEEEFYYQEGRRPELSTVKLRYVAPFIDYTFYRKGRWEATLPLQLGIGTSYLQPHRTPQHQKQDWVMLYEPAMSVEYKFMKYFAVGGGYGYRIMLKNNKELSSKFTSPMYVLRFRILFDLIYKTYKQQQQSHE